MYGLGARVNEIFVCFFQSPMATRLSRLQREMNEKNDEICRLQSEVMTESDENATLRRSLEDVQLRLREAEKKNAELRQRLDDIRSAEGSLHEPEAEILRMAAQLRKLQGDYEAVCQKFCDINIAHEHVISQRDRDRKQV